MERKVEKIYSNALEHFKDARYLLDLRSEPGVLVYCYLLENGIEEPLEFEMEFNEIHEDVLINLVQFGFKFNRRTEDFLNREIRKDSSIFYFEIDETTELYRSLSLKLQKVLRVINKDQRNFLIINCVDEDLRTSKQLFLMLREWYITKSLNKIEIFNSSLTLSYTRQDFIVISSKKNCSPLSSFYLNIIIENEVENLEGVLKENLNKDCLIYCDWDTAKPEYKLALYKLAYIAMRLRFKICFQNEDDAFNFKVVCSILFTKQKAGIRYLKHQYELEDHNFMLDEGNKLSDIVLVKVLKNNEVELRLNMIDLALVLSNYPTETLIPIISPVRKEAEVSELFGLEELIPDIFSDIKKSILGTTDLELRENQLQYNLYDNNYNCIEEFLKRLQRILMLTTYHNVFNVRDIVCKSENGRIYVGVLDTKDLRVNAVLYDLKSFDSGKKKVINNISDIFSKSYKDVDDNIHFRTDKIQPNNLLPTYIIDNWTTVPDEIFYGNSLGLEEMTTRQLESIYFGYYRTGVSPLRSVSKVDKEFVLRFLYEIGDSNVESNRVIYSNLTALDNNLEKSIWTELNGNVIEWFPQTDW